MIGMDKSIMKAILSGELSHEQKRAIANIIQKRATGTNEEKSLLVSQADVARMLRISRFTVYRMEKEGRIKPVYLTKDLKRYRRKDIEEMAFGDGQVMD
jgi:DNA-binding XRE family transcriptional regulator